MRSISGQIREAVRYAIINCERYSVLDPRFPARFVIRDLQDLSIAACYVGPVAVAGIYEII